MNGDNKLSTEVKSRPSIAKVNRSVASWALSRTDRDSPRQRELMREKRKIVKDFFDFIEYHAGEPIPPALVEDDHVTLWKAKLQEDGLSAATIYKKVTQLSSYFKWLIQPDAKKPPRHKFGVPSNPTDGVRPQAPKNHNSKLNKPVKKHHVEMLLSVIRQAVEDAEHGSVSRTIALRDYAIFWMLTYTAKRRAEVMRLTRGDLDFSVSPLVITFPRMKGGRKSTKPVKEARVVLALLEYLKASKRDPEKMADDAALWLSHKASGCKVNGRILRSEAKSPLSSHTFAVRMKKYAAKADEELVKLGTSKDGLIGKFWLHRLRHGVGEKVWIETEGDLNAVRLTMDQESMASAAHYVGSTFPKPDMVDKLNLVEAIGLGDPSEPIFSENYIPA